MDVTLEMDTAKDQWSIAAGTYSCRFTPGTAVAAHMAANQIRDKLGRIAAKQLNTLPDDIEFAKGKIGSKRNPDNAIPFGRVAGTAHWSPVMLPEGMAPSLRETAVWSPPELEPPSNDDRINTSLTYGFVFDMCGVEIDPLTNQVRVDRYVSMHDAGKILNPMIADGQMRGSFAQGIAAALYEEFIYDETGAFLSGTFADYLVPTASEIPRVEILHMESPSPFTPLGAKGLAEGNCMSVPACIANAVADALGVKDVPMPVTPRRIHALMAQPEPPSPVAAPAREAAAAPAVEGGRNLRGQSSFEVPAPPAAVWRSLLDPQSLKAVIPGCHELQRLGENDYRALVSLGVGPVRGKFEATVKLSDLVTEKSGRIVGALSGPLGGASGGGKSPSGSDRHRHAHRLRLCGHRHGQGRLGRRAPARWRCGDHHPAVLRAAGATVESGGRTPSQFGVAAAGCLAALAGRRRRMKPHPFDYVRADTVDEATELLAQHGDDARVLAGGQSLLAMLNLRLLEPAVLIDIARISELSEIREVGGKVEVGAAVTQNRLLAWPGLKAKLPLLAAAMPFVGHFQTRNKGTVCGSIAHADPSSEIPLSLATLQGEVVLRSRSGTRVLPASEFQRGMLMTARKPDELITAVRFPIQTSRRVAFREVARRHGDFAIVAIAAVANGNKVRLGVGGMAGRPATREFTAGTDLRDAINALAWELEGYEDMHATSHMRRDILRRVGPVVIEEALQCAE